MKPLPTPAPGPGRVVEAPLLGVTWPRFAASVVLGFAALVAAVIVLVPVLHWILQWIAWAVGVVWSWAASALPQPPSSR